MNKIIQKLKQYAAGKSRGKHIFLSAPEGSPKEISHTEFAKNAFLLGENLKKENISSGDICFIVSSNQYFQLLNFYACITIGAIPLMGSYLPKFGAESDILEKIAYWRSLFGERFKVVTDLDFPTNHAVSQVKNPYIEQDILYLQSSSATTGEPKAITISEKNILKNVEQIKLGLQAGKKEVFVSWLPLYHDMGLVGGEWFPFLNDYDIVLLSPFDFSRRPLNWLKAISDYRASITAIPAFAIEHVLETNPDLESLKNLDLSSLHSICIGAEPVRMESLQKFNAYFEAYGLNPTAFVPCYGLAESTLAATFKPARTESKSLWVIQDSIKQGGKVTLAECFSEGAVPVTSVGKLVKGLSGYIRHDGKRVSAELVCGEICLCGPSITEGYLGKANNFLPLPQKTLNTGDIGFIYEDEFYVIDRDKNIIILNGVNYVASDLESEISEQFGVKKRNVIVFENQILSKKDEKEIIAVIEIKKGETLDENPEAFLEKNLRPNGIVKKVTMVKRGFIELTSSGKKRYFLARKKYVEGKFESLKTLSL